MLHCAGGKGTAAHCLASTATARGHRDEPKDRCYPLLIGEKATAQLPPSSRYFIERKTRTATAERIRKEGRPELACWEVRRSSTPEGASGHDVSYLRRRGIPSLPTAALSTRHHQRKRIGGHPVPGSYDLDNKLDGFYIFLAFIDKLVVHITKNFLKLPNIKVPPKSFQCELVFKKMGIKFTWETSSQIYNFIMLYIQSSTSYSSVLLLKRPFLRNQPSNNGKIRIPTPPGRIDAHVRLHGNHDGIKLPQPPRYEAGAFNFVVISQIELAGESG
nr:ribulose bisphosphate carboxylase/oxygenase activase 1, chloroplastic isoform X2 [Ipomoea batatas]